MSNVKEFLINKKNPIFYIFQILFIVFLFDEYFTYFLIFNIGVFYALLAYVDNNKIQFWLIFFVLIGSCFYSVVSLFYKNPNYYYDVGKIEEGSYVIQELRIKTRQMGSLTGRDSLIEPSSRKSLYLKNIKSGTNILVECSITEIGCPFYNDIGRKIYVKYIESNFFSRNYAFYIRYDSEVFNEAYFEDKYKKENYIKIFFIFFYLGGIFLYAYISVREKKFL
ncbi:hypothetical protein [Acinetobacter sp. ANC 3813]|uniref:hypothetical protein n=1 Tax=Acinetobacter sp. ANC 3813 TaxID=1977873 RepID=UPI000A331EDD|nr:hypothetical protein [Acinetobacter sp. ANC 3813]OTG88627.1 hypothetical protein B9T34_14865 [Acinetobacter sp. ANC 3813]